MIGIAIILGLLIQAAPVAQRTAGRAGTVAGQIQTRDGFPAVAVRVSAIPAPPASTRASDGQNYWATQVPVSTALTNEQGRYRLANVPPGRYYLVAGMLGRATYYPSATEAERATVVTIGPEASETLDFKLVLPHGGRLSGRISPPSGSSPERAVLSGLKLDELLEMPINPDGTFTFGHVPTGAYLLSVFPTPPGTGSLAFDVGETDINVEIKRLPLRTIAGRIAVQNGPLPKGMLAFTTGQSYVSATINPDGTFAARLQSGRHQVEMPGMPVGYAIASVRSNAADPTQGIIVGQADVPDVVITVAAPRRLPAIRGRIDGVAGPRFASAKVELTGPIVGTLDAAITSDGSFEFPALTPGRYNLRVPQIAEVAPVDVVVSASDTQVTIGMAAR